MEILINILIVIVVLLVFNFVIFIHELGHFLAAKWRGMKVDRFQIWFGKPIWKKTIGGVQYGIGWIPAGGFVSLPQMVDMERIEGKVDDEEKSDLPPAKPFDKIIVAFAGPLFSFLLAMSVAVIVWVVGVPENRLNTTTIGYVAEGTPADGKFKLGDKILEVEGEKVNYWTGSPPHDTVTFQIVISNGETVDFKVERDGEIVEISTGYKIPETHWLQRNGRRQVGIGCERECLVKKVIKNSPAELAGLKPGDRIASMDGAKVWGHGQFSDMIKGKGKMMITFERGGKETVATVEVNGALSLDKFASFVKGSEKDVVIEQVFEGGLARAAGLEAGDKITKIDDISIEKSEQVVEILAKKSMSALIFERDGKFYGTAMTHAKPKGYSSYKAGLVWDGKDKYAEFAGNIVHRNPVEQSVNHVSLMWTTLAKIISLDNNISPQDLQSPVGIGMTYFDLLKSEHGFRLILTFTVLLNINLAILNLLPLPVLDGGHITMSLYEILMGKPLPTKATVFVQASFVLLLLSFMFWIMTKDVFDRWLTGDNAPKEQGPPPEMVFDPPKDGVTRVKPKQIDGQVQ